MHTSSTQLKAARDQLAASFSKSHVDDIVAEKDEQITGLMNEGEKLSKQQLTLNTTIKKLRARVKESEDKLKKTEERANKAEEHAKELEIDLKELQVKKYFLPKLILDLFFFAPKWPKLCKTHPSAPSCS